MEHFRGSFDLDYPYSLLYLCINKNDKVMKANYFIRPVVDSNDFVEYYEFVRVADDAIIYSLFDFSTIYSYALGFCNAKNSTFIIL